jgi:biopolymer transport protein ExbB/TolQ
MGLKMESVSLSPMGLFAQAGPVGKTVIILLGVASVWCWYQVFDGLLGIVRLGGSLKHARRNEEGNLLDVVIGAGIEEMHQERFTDESTGDLRQLMMEAMSREGRMLMSRLEGGLPNLAVIASVAPFVGLFGTVWGIMVAFTAIADSNDTSLAVVAPGIAEALATTAFGLVAAIPASIAYSRLGASFAAKGQDLANFIEEKSLSLLRANARRGGH